MSQPMQPLRMGPIAHEILSHDGKAEVIAVFERCFYLAAPDGIVCIGLETLGDGPLHVVLSGLPSPLLWSRLGITREAKGWVRDQRLGVGEMFAIDLTARPVWLPAPWPATTAEKIRASLENIENIAAPACPAEGLSRLVLAPASPRDRSAAAASPLVSEFAEALARACVDQQIDARLRRVATLLVGLGPGLTPSGDDLLGGVFMTLSALHQTALRDALWAAIEPELDVLTLEISAAHLAAAGDGFAAATVHTTLDALLTNDDAALASLLPALGALGQTSGFDILAGIVLTLRAALSAQIVGR